jgi:outer membrane receptor protein involved in Fe transport
MTFKRQLLYGLACVPCIAIPAIANAQAAASQGAQNTALQEVVVTAERRTTNIQKTPASVSVRTGQELDDQGRITTREILQDVPGVVAVDNVSNRNLGTSDVQGNNITIRGIAASNSAVGGVSGISAAAGAAVYTDGVYEGIGSGYDIQRVEVLRGPQGTLYGRSATTGVVAFYTRDPELGKFGGDASAEVGNYDLQHYSGAINVPLGDKLAARISGDYYDQAQGYYGEATRGDMKREDGRVKLLWKPTDNFSLLVGGAYEKRDDFGGGKSYFAALPSLVQQAPVNSVLVPGGKEDKQFWAQANWNVGPVTLTYLPAYRSWTQNDTSINVNMFNTGLNSRTTQKTPKDDFWTHEFRISNNNDGGFKWQTGVFYYDNNLANSVRAQFETTAGVPGAITTQSSDTRATRNIGVFAETTIPLRDSLRLTLGGRYDDTQVLVGETLYQDAFQLCGNGIGVRFPLPPGVVCTGVGTASVPSPAATTISGVKLHFNEFSYKARLEYDVTPKNMLYGMISTAYRPGDAGIQNGAPFFLADQKLTSIEVGSKNRFFNDSLQVNASLFHYDYQGFQVLYQTDIFVPISFVNTTVPATNIGAELEILYRLTQHDRIGLDVSYVESRWYNKSAGFQAAYPLMKRELTPYTINGNYTHVFNLPGGSILSARIDGQYQAAHQAEDLQAQYLNIGFAQYEHREAELIGNLSAVWSTGRYSLSAYVRNFTGQQYKLYTVSTNLTRVALDWSDPRTFGAKLAVHF